MHNRNLHNNFDVQFGDYDLIGLDHPYTGKTATDRDDKENKNIGDNEKSDNTNETKVKSKFKTPLRRQVSLLPMSESDHIKVSPPPAAGPSIEVEVCGEPQPEIESVQQRIEKMTNIVKVGEVATKLTGNTTAPRSSKLKVAIGNKSKLKGNKTKRGLKKEGTVNNNPKGPKFNYFEGFTMSKISLEPLEFGWSNVSKNTGAGKNIPKHAANSSKRQEEIVTSSSFNEPERSSREALSGGVDMSKQLDSKNGGEKSGCLVATVNSVESSSLQEKELTTSQQSVSGLSSNTTRKEVPQRSEPGETECLVSPTKGWEGAGVDRLKEMNNNGEENSSRTSEQSVSIRYTDKSSNSPMTPKLRKSKQRKTKSKLRCEDSKCLPCTILENCKTCYFCLNRSKLR